MEIAIGSDVNGTDGKLGEVQGVLVDARTDTVTDLVVKHGLIFPDARVVPLTHVVRVESNAVYLDLDEEGFKAMDGLAEEIKGSNPDYVGPPGHDLEGTHRGNFVYRTHIASLSLFRGKTMGYPGGEQITPDLRERPTLEPGMDVLTTDGERIGEVGDFALDPATGAITRLSMRRGTIFKHETELPTEWVRDLASDGVILNVSKGEIEVYLARF